MPEVRVPQRYLDALSGIFRRYPAVEEVRLFGSRACGSPRRASDIDLAVAAPGMPPGRWASLVLDLAEAPIVYEIDPVRWDAVRAGPLLEKIRRDGVRIYRRA